MTWSLSNLTFGKSSLDTSFWEGFSNSSLELFGLRNRLEVEEFENPSHSSESSHSSTRTFFFVDFVPVNSLY